MTLTEVTAWYLAGDQTGQIWSKMAHLPWLKVGGWKDGFIWDYQHGVCALFQDGSFRIAELPTRLVQDSQRKDSKKHRQKLQGFSGPTIRNPRMLFLLHLFGQASYQGHLGSAERQQYFNSQKVKVLSHVRLFATPWAIQSVEFSRPEYWGGQLFSSPGDLPYPRIKPRSPTLQPILYQLSHQGNPN